MKVWMNYTFSGRLRSSTSAVVVADTAMQAADLLTQKLKDIGLPQTIDAETMHRLPVSRPIAVVLQDGDY